jgi:hypothetical protein
LLVASDSLNTSTNTLSQAELLRLKLNMVGGCFAIVSGPSPVMNLLDMFVLVTLTRITVEEQWVPGTQGESARAFLKVCREGETGINLIAASILEPEQIEELRSAITQWRQDHPDLRSAVFKRALGIAEDITQTRRAQQAPAPGSVFSLLMLDPLSGLDPAARELAQTRLFAERALFTAQRMPMLLRWQMELLLLESSETPAIQEMRTNTAQIAAWLERTGNIVEAVPSLIRSERKEILEAVASQELGLTNVAAQVKAALDAGRHMSDSFNSTLTVFDRVQKDLLGKNSEMPGAAHTESEPFRIQDYVEAAQHLDSVAQRLTDLLLTLDETLASTNLAQVSIAVRQAEVGGRAVVNYTFRTAVVFVAITCACVLASALLFQWQMRRWNRTS